MIPIKSGDRLHGLGSGKSTPSLPYFILQQHGVGPIAQCNHGVARLTEPDRIRLSDRCKDLISIGQLIRARPTRPIRKWIKVDYGPYLLVSSIKCHRLELDSL